MKKILIALLLIVPVSLSAQKKEIDQLPGFALKTNLLYDLTTTMNLGIEFRTGGHTSIDIPVNWNPWNFNGDFSLKHVMVQPELRIWPKETFKGHFFGINGQYADYDMGGFPHGPFTQYMKDNRFDGWAAGAGISWGYRWNFSYNWGLEVTLGVGYLHKDYDIYACATCGEEIGSRTKNYFGPTKAGVNLIWGLGRKPAPAPEPVMIVVERYEPKFVPSYITPEVEAVKARQETGRAYLEFQVGRSEILPEFRTNPEELKLIKETVDLVKNDSDVTIKEITITGNASPEGGAANNQRLSEDRAAALEVYMEKTYGIDSRLITSVGDGEDWAGLEMLLEESSIADKAEALRIVRNGNADLDRRENELKALNGGTTYNTIKAQIYPDLRRTDYELDYEVAPISVERGKQILKTRPSNLSLNEMFRIANTYPEGSTEFREAMETAARVFPDSDVANLNAAASALARKDVAAAETYLGKVKNHNSDWQVNMGILAGLKGDTVRAAEYFSRAGSAGAHNAAELRKHVESITIIE